MNETTLNRIDFFGPAGVGKSSHFEYLIDESQRKRSWATVAELEQICARRQARKYERIWRRMMLAGGLAAPRLSVPIARYINRQREEDCFKRFSETYGEFFRFAIHQACIAEKNEYRRALGYYRFIYYFLRWAVYYDNVPSVTVVCDESLTQRMHSVLSWTDNGLKACSEYCRLMPRPEAVVIFYGSVDSIVRNIYERGRRGGKVIPGHRELQGEELRESIRIQLRMNEEVAKVLSDRGSEVLEISCEEMKIKENSERIRRFAEARSL